MAFVTCFILWCKNNLNLKANSMKSCLSALQTISKLLGLKNQKSAKDSAKLLVRGIERTENQKLTGKTDPLVFEILVELREIIKNKGWKKAKQKCSLDSSMFGIFWIISGKWTAYSSSELVWPIRKLFMVWLKFCIWFKSFCHYQKSENEWK